MRALFDLSLAWAVFVASHLMMSHPLRSTMVKRMGEQGFLAFYSLLSIALLALIGSLYHSVSSRLPSPLWEAGDAAWWIATIVMLLASILFVGSIAGNPALPTMTLSRKLEPKGVLRITRHPMMWSFALWAAVHATVNATPASLVSAAGVATLALVGAAGQDAKKLKLNRAWQSWMEKTSFFPFGRGFALPGAFSLIGGSALWILATWGHEALGYTPAGIFHFFG